MRVTKKFLTDLKNNPIVVLDKLEEADIAKLIQKANLAYRNGKDLLMSDDMYDSVIEYMEKRNPEHPVLKAIGAAVTSGKKVKLPYFMGSLDKIKTDDKLIDKFTTQYKCSYIVSEKLDGNSALYTGGKLYTRGDGTEGQDISHLINVVKHLPKLNDGGIAVRGELIISRRDFEKVKDKGANARNMVAGLLNAKTPDLELARNIQFVAYELISPEMLPELEFKFMQDLGFKVVKAHLVSQDVMTTSYLSDVLIDSRKNSEFEVDGIVIMHNGIHKRVSGENPKYAFAFKSVATMEKAEVIVTKVEWNLSKDGYLIPVVQFNAVHLAGVMIQKAHGFNGKYIKDNVIGPGSRIVIMRSGDVIPYILEVLAPSETKQPSMPTVEYEWTDTGVDIKLKNKDGNEELALKNIQYFFDKIDVQGVSSGTIKRLFVAGYKDIKSIIQITKDDLLKVDGFKTKSADNFMTAIKNAFKEVDCIKLMDASNVLGRGMGAKKIKLIVDNIPKIRESQYIPKTEELIAIKGIEKKTAETFVANLPAYHKFVKNIGIQCFSSKPIKSKQSTDSSLEGQIIVFSGFRDKDLEEKIIEAGGKVSTTVSSKTTLMLVKTQDASSSKVVKANELGIPIKLASEFFLNDK